MEEEAALAESSVGSIQYSKLFAWRGLLGWSGLRYHSILNKIRIFEGRSNCLTNLGIFDANPVQMSRLQLKHLLQHPGRKCDYLRFWLAHPLFFGPSTSQSANWKDLDTHRQNHS